MKARQVWLLVAVGWVWVVFVQNPVGHAQVNSWTNTTGNTYWEYGWNWSLGMGPSINQSALFITNANAKTISMAYATDPQYLTVSNLTISAPLGQTNTLDIHDLSPPQFHLLNFFYVKTGGSLSISNANVRVGDDDTSYYVPAFVVDGTTTVLADGMLVTTNSGGASVGNTGTGSFLLDGGTWLADGVAVPNGLEGARGTVRVAAGLLDLTDSLSLGDSGTGTVWVTGGTLSVTAGPTYIGVGYRPWNLGQLIVSNGIYQAREVSVGFDAPGELTVAGGTTELSASLVVGDVYSYGNGKVWVTGGQLVVTNDFTMIGAGQPGAMTVSSGIFLAKDVIVSSNSTAQGTFTVAGGTNELRTLTVGVEAVATGTVWVTGGRLVASVPWSAIGDQGVGTVTVSNGFFQLSNAYVGHTAGSQGRLNVAGGEVAVPVDWWIGDDAGSTGTVSITGGTLTTGGHTWIGYGGDGSLTVSNGSVDSAAMIFVGGTSAGANGRLTVAGGTLRSGIGNYAGSGITVGLGVNSTGTVWITGGELIVTNSVDTAKIVVSQEGYGEWIQDGGRVLTDHLFVTNAYNNVFLLNGGTFTSHYTVFGYPGYCYVGDAGRTATLQLNGSTHTFTNTLEFGISPGSAGIGEVRNALVSSAVAINVGRQGEGLLTVSNSMVKTAWLIAGVSIGGSGTVTLMQGTLVADVALSLGDDASTWGTLTMKQSELIMTNGIAYVGGRFAAGTGELMFSNSTARVQRVWVASKPGSQGWMEVDKGTFAVDQELVLGNYECTSTANLELIAGNLLVTNAAATAALDVRGGSLWQYGGLLQVDRLVVTNECGRARLLAGARAIGELVLPPDFDADGDGMPNAWETGNDLDPLTPVGDQGADGDPDGDGHPNIAELQAGTNPHNPDSAFRIVAIEREGEDVRVTWTCSAGHSYIVQTNATASDGSVTVTFDDLTEPIPVYGEGESVTNYLHVGGGLVSAHYYRVRLGPPAVPGILGGTVFNTSDAPIPGATVTAPGGYEATADETGQYELVLPPGTYDVTASAPGYASQTHTDVLVEPDPVTPLNFVLTPVP